MYRLRNSIRCTLKLGPDWHLLETSVFFFFTSCGRRLIPRQGLKEARLSVEAWQRALDTLPKENLTPSAMKQREQYIAGLAAAKRRLSRVDEPEVIVVEQAKGKMPWDLAQKERVTLDLSSVEGRRSSVSPNLISFRWVVLVC